jgi:hypothetical protein
VSVFFFRAEPVSHHPELRAEFFNNNMSKRAFPFYMPSTEDDRKAKVKLITNEEENVKDDEESDNNSIESSDNSPVILDEHYEILDDGAEMFEKNKAACKTEDEQNILFLFQKEYDKCYFLYYNRVIASSEDYLEYNPTHGAVNSIDNQSNLDSEVSDHYEKSHQEINEAIKEAKNVRNDFLDWMKTINL